VWSYAGEAGGTVTKDEKRLLEEFVKWVWEHGVDYYNYTVSDLDDLVREFVEARESS